MRDLLDTPGRPTEDLRGEVADAAYHVRAGECRVDVGRNETSHANHDEISQEILNPSPSISLEEMWRNGSADVVQGPETFWSLTCTRQAMSLEAYHFMGVNSGRSEESTFCHPSLETSSKCSRRRRASWDNMDGLCIARWMSGDHDNKERKRNKDNIHMEAVS